MIARLGGEEFALLLPDTDEAAAIKLCDRLRAEIAQTVCLTAQGPVRITVSGGVAALAGDGLDAALKRADERALPGQEPGPRPVDPGGRRLTLAEIEADAQPLAA